MATAATTKNGAKGKKGRKPKTDLLRDGSNEEWIDEKVNYVGKIKTPSHSGFKNINADKLPISLKFKEDGDLETFAFLFQKSIFGDSDLDPGIIAQFLYLYAKEFMNFRSPKHIKSFQTKIYEHDQVTIDTIVKITRGNSPCPKPLGESFSTATLKALAVLALTCVKMEDNLVHRRPVFLFRKAQDKVKSLLSERTNGLEWDRLDLLPDWLNGKKVNRANLQMCAAIDFLVNLSHREDWNDFKYGSGFAYCYEMGAWPIIDYWKELTRSYGKDPGDYVIMPKASAQYKRIVYDEEAAWLDYSQTASWVPYLKSAWMTGGSHFSASANRELVTFIHCVGCVTGRKRSITAPLLSNVTLDVFRASLFVCYSLRHFSSKTCEVPQELQPQNLPKYMKTQTQFPPYLKRYIMKMEAIDSPWKGSVGATIKKVARNIDSM